MVISGRTITTDPRHIDPNPDRIQPIPSSKSPSASSTPSSLPALANPVIRSSKPTSLLLLSTSAEAAVAESKRFERGSRHSSLSISLRSSSTSPDPKPNPPKPSVLVNASQLTASSSSSSSSPSSSSSSSSSLSSPPPSSRFHPSLTSDRRQHHHPAFSSASSASSSSSSPIFNHHHRHHHQARTLSQSPLRNHHYRQRLHHRFTPAIAIQNTHPVNIPTATTTSSSPNTATTIHTATTTIIAPSTITPISTNTSTATTTNTNNTHHPSNASNLDHRRDQSKADTHLFKCEKCFKVYRHPQCLVKHRWEHTSYWADASKLMLSKHQQVQMLEAAAILAAPSGSLPESRSLWPAAVSPSEAGLLGSDRVNLDVIQSRQVTRPSTVGTRHSGDGIALIAQGSTSTSRDSVSGDRTSQNTDQDIEMIHNESEVGADGDEIMFEMTLDGDEGSCGGSDRNDHKGEDRPIVGNHHNLRPIESDRSNVVRSSESLNAVSGFPPIGFFERRNPQSISSVISTNLSEERSLGSSSSFSSHHSSSLSSSSSSSSPLSSTSSLTTSTSSLKKDIMVFSTLPAMVAYQPIRMSDSKILNDDDHQDRDDGGKISGFVYRSSESIFKPIKLYQDSHLRFEGRKHPHPHPSFHQCTNQPSSFAVNRHINHDDQDTEDEQHHVLNDDEEDEEEDDTWSQSAEREREREGDEVIEMEL